MDQSRLDLDADMHSLSGEGGESDVEAPKAAPEMPEMENRFLTVKTRHPEGYPDSIPRDDYTLKKHSFFD